MTRFRHITYIWLLPALLTLVGAQRPPVDPAPVRSTPARSGAETRRLDTTTPRTRTNFRSLDPDKAPQRPIGEADFTGQTKQALGKAAGVNEGRPLSPDLKAKVAQLSDPTFLRTLGGDKSALDGNRTPWLGSPGRAVPDKALPWSPDTKLANPTDMNDEYVALAQSPLSGDLYAVFSAQDLGGTDRDIHIAHSDDAGLTWTVTEMPAYALDEYHPNIAIDAGGYIHVVWVRDDGWILRARTTQADDISDWAWVKGLGTDEVNANPSVAVSGSGDFARVFIAANWLTVNYDSYQLEWTIIWLYSTTGGQTGIYDYFDPDGYQDLWPGVTMNGGLVHMVNAEVDMWTGETEIIYAHDTYDGTFFDVASFTGGTSFNCGFPRIASQGDDVFVVYQEDYSDGVSTDGDILYTYSWDGGETFFGPFGMAADEYESVGPAIFTRDGVVSVLWLDAPPGADEFWLGSRTGGGFGLSTLFGDVEIVSDDPRVEPMFHSCQGLVVEGQLLAAWIDRRDYPTEGHNVYQSRRAVEPNLSPFIPAGWDSSLVVNMARGERTNGFLAADDTVFVSFAANNSGLTDIASPFLLRLELDGVEVAQWIANDGLALGAYLPVEDVPVVAGPGPHALTVTLDLYNLIAEADETDNTLEKTYLWVAGDPELRLSTQSLSRTITPQKSRSAALALVTAPLLKRQVNLPVISPELSAAMSDKAVGERLRVMIVPAERLDAAAMNLALKDASRATRREVITLAAKRQVDVSHADLSGTLNSLLTAGQADAPRPLWLSGTLAMAMTPAAVEQLAGDPAVGYLYLDETRSETFGGPVPVTYRDATSPADKAPAWHLASIGADQVWSSGVTGTGILVGHLDSGVAYDHPDLAGQMWDGGTAYPNHGWDSVDEDDDPYDGDIDWGHGTHTAGLIIGDGTGGTATGAAPGATLMALRAVPGYMDDLIEGLQFGLDNGVHLFNLSGGWSQAGDDTRAANRHNAELLLSIDVPWICSAGNGDNYGGHNTVPTDIVSPGDCPGPRYAPNGGHTAVVAVGAVNQDASVWAYSSYGPTQWDLTNPYGESDFADYPWTPGLIKPDLTAPGGGLTSTSHNGGYVDYSGTSMSCPLVTSAFCLIWSALPQLTVPQVTELLETTATDISVSPAAPGRDNYTGAGLINLPAALGQLPTAEAESFWIHNDGTSPLIIDSVTWNSAWLDIQLPRLSVDPGDSVQATAVLDPADLPEGGYYDQVVFASNDPNSPAELAVILYYGEGVSPAPDDVPEPAAPVLTNHPNPFNPRTVLRYRATGSAPVRLVIYDVRGRQVRALRDDRLEPGMREVIWDGMDDHGQAVGSGQYFAVLREGDRDPVKRKLMLVR